MHVLTDGVFDANPIMVGIMLAVIVAATLTLLIRRLWHR